MIVESKIKEIIYALYYLDSEQNKKYFYVGRTGREPKFRLQEHIRNSESQLHNEDVYCFIREKQLMRCGVNLFEMEELASWEESVSIDDCEDFYVITLIRAGCDLQNMKHGDLKKLAYLNGAATSTELLSTPADVRRYRIESERKNRERSAQLRAEIRGETVRKDVFSSPEYQEKERVRLDALRAEKQAKEGKKKERQSVADMQHQKWLAEMNHLFDEGKIDALGNPLYK